jgi:lipase
MRAALEVAMPDGARLPVYRFAGPAGSQRLLFGHANGLAAGSYEPWLERLARHFEVFAFDARGHGASRWPEGPLETVFSVDRMADDLMRVAAAVGGALACVGHSLGGASALRLAGQGRAAFTRLVIFEPPLFPPPGHPMHEARVAAQQKLVAGTLKRRTHWPSPEAFAMRLQERGMFRRFDSAMLKAHCQATLIPESQGGYRLRCPPAIESFIFASHAAADTWLLLRRVAAPVDLVGGDPDMPDNDWISGAIPDMAAEIPHARVTQVKGAGHLLISEQPEHCAQLVRDLLAGK